MKIKKYANNLRLVVNKKKDTSIVSFNIFVGVGSKDDPKDCYGIAHFLEHMFFKSTKDTKYQEILQKLDNLGVSHNAYTSVTKTCYYFKCLSSALEQAISLFSKMFFNTSFNKNEIESEKKVILEEYKMDEDDQTKKSVINAFNSMFYGSSFGHSIVGTASSIKAITATKLKHFKQKYTSNRVVISISGNVSFKKIDRLVKKYFVKMFTNQVNSIEYEQYNKINISNKYLAKNKDNKQSIVYILQSHGKLSLRQRAVFRLYYSILGDGLCSKFMEQIRGKLGLVYDIDAGSSDLGINTMGEIMFATSNENVKQALIEIKRIMQECANGDILSEELDRAKNKFLSNLAFGNESNSNIASSNGSAILSKGFIRTDKQIKQELLSITLDEVKEIAKIVATNKDYVVSSVGLCGKSDLKVFNL